MTLVSLLKSEGLKELSPSQMTQQEALNFFASDEFDFQKISKSAAKAIAQIAYPGVPEPVIEVFVNRNYPLIQKSCYDRRYPRVNLIDNRSKASELGLCFADREILMVHRQCLYNKVGRVVVFKTEDSDRVVIQQQSLRGCTAAVTAMLCFPHNEEMDLSYLKHRDLVGDEEMVKDIQTAGLEPKVSFFKVRRGGGRLEELEELIDQNGPAIVGVDIRVLGGHEIIIDQVNEESVDLREPYHGWSITVQRKIIERVLSVNNPIIQV